MPLHRSRKAALLATLGLATMIFATAPAAAEEATATLKSPQGDTVGTVVLSETPHGVLLAVKIADLPPGPHAFHIHAVGDCTAPDFKSAGGHYNPAKHQHGIENPNGKHAGDLPNIHVSANGMQELEVLAEAVTLTDGGARATLFDADGSAIVVHAGADDYASDPAGAAGARIACGVVELIN
ncbi:MAG: superoxide dismutase family protein [Alphaproteobacteria bacterium]|jgi:Cu-Zn family superoxide dismutase